MDAAKLHWELKNNFERKTMALCVCVAILEDICTGGPKYHINSYKIIKVIRSSFLFNKIKANFS